MGVLLRLGTPCAQAGKCTWLRHPKGPGGQGDVVSSSHTWHRAQVCTCLLTQVQSCRLMEAGDPLVQLPRLMEEREPHSYMTGREAFFTSASLSDSLPFSSCPPVSSALPPLSLLSSFSLVSWPPLPSKPLGLWASCSCPPSPGLCPHR